MRSKYCADPGCAELRSPKAGRGLCITHYNLHRKNGTIDRFERVNVRAETAEAKFFHYTEATKSCWWWTGPTNQAGYGVLSHNYAETYAHRWSWEHLIGQIPEGMTIDHLCTNKVCVNPEHLEVVSLAVNSSRRHGNRVFCQRGHSMDDAYVRPDGDGRQCATCVRDRGARKWANRTRVQCEYCAKEMSDVNLRAHQKKWCHGEANPRNSESQTADRRDRYGT